jgi:hypothetical protein
MLKEHRSYDFGSIWRSLIRNPRPENLQNHGPCGRKRSTGHRSQ